MRIFFDTEFIEDGSTIDLLSIGLVREDGEELYLESRDADWSRADEWVQKNVLPNLESYRFITPQGRIVEEGGTQIHAVRIKTGCCVGRDAMRKRILRFAGADPEFWAYYADYDWVVLCQLFGRMIDLPNHWPKFCMDLKQLIVTHGNPEVPKLSEDVAHNALSDARWVRDIHGHFERGSLP